MSYKAIKKFREDRKILIIEAFGGSCGLCGYNKFHKALDLHHLDPTKKEIEISKNILSWDRLVVELKKCVLLCSNCHREVHGGFVSIPKDINRFDKVYENHYEREKRYCPVCNKDMTDKQLKQKTCSFKCSEVIHKRGKVDWDEVGLEQLVKIKSIQQIADQFNVVWTTVKRAMVKRNIVS